MNFSLHYRPSYVGKEGKPDWKGREQWKYVASEKKENENSLKSSAEWEWEPSMSFYPSCASQNTDGQKKNQKWDSESSNRAVAGLMFTMIDVVLFLCLHTIEIELEKLGTNFHFAKIFIKQERSRMSLVVT